MLSWFLCLKLPHTSHYFGDCKGQFSKNLQLILRSDVSENIEYFYLYKENLIDKKIWCEHFKEEFKLIDSDIDMYLSKKYYTENFLPCNMYNSHIVNPQFQLTVCRTRNGYTMSDTSNFTQEELDNYEYWKTPIDLK